MSQAAAVLQHAHTQTDNVLAVLKDLVLLESPSYGDKAASDACAAYLRDLFASIGCEMTMIPQARCGDQVMAGFGTGERRIMLCGHYDTVFPVGTLASMPWKVEDGKACGPGVLDMKGGITLGFFALKALKELGIDPGKRIVFFMNSDEEAGSHDSKERIVREALASECVLMLEPGLAGRGDVKTSRSGRAVYKIAIQGRSAHSGIEPARALSAVTELARLAPYFEALNDYPQGSTVATTYMTAGVDDTAMVPGEGHMTLDVRALSIAALDSLCRGIEAASPSQEGVSLDIRGGAEKQPFEFNEQNRALFARADELARELGFPLKANHIGGGSDANFTAAAGVPSLDGLGMTGEFTHNVKEYITIADIPYRLALLTRMLATL